MTSLTLKSKTEHPDYDPAHAQIQFVIRVEAPLSRIMSELVPELSRAWHVEVSRDD
jgi:hypothetical protein